VCRRIGIFLNNFARSRNPLSPFVDSVRSSRSPCPHAPTEKVSCCSRLREAAEFRSTKRWACEVISPRLLPRETPFLFPRFSKIIFNFLLCHTDNTSPFYFVLCLSSPGARKCLGSALPSFYTSAHFAFRKPETDMTWIQRLSMTQHYGA
jgi:hypothetical protein